MGLASFNRARRIAEEKMQAELNKIAVEEINNNLMEAAKIADETIKEESIESAKKIKTRKGEE
jgi:hypothetical protein